MRKISTIIKEARIKKGLSQEELANLIFVTKQSISKYENGHTYPSHEIKEKLEEVLNIKIGNSFNQKNKISNLIFISLLILLSIGLIFTTSNLVLLRNDYKNLENDTDELLENKIIEYNTLLETYNTLRFEQETLEASYNSLIGDYSSLESDLLWIQNELNELMNKETLTYNGIEFIYTTHTIIDNYVMVEFTVQNSTQNDIVLNALAFTTDDINNEIKVSDDNHYFYQFYSRTLESYEMDKFYLKIYSDQYIDKTNNYFELIDQITLYYASEIFVVLEL